MMGVSPIAQSPPETTRRAPARLKSLPRQIYERFQLKAHCLLSGPEYKLYRFGERDKDYRYMMNFLTGYAMQYAFRLTLNDPRWKVLLDNKWLFQMHYQQFGIPLPRLYGIYQPGSGFSVTGRPLASTADLRAFFDEIRPASLVAKPLGGIMGRRVLILSDIQYQGATIRATTNTGQQITFDELANTLNSPPKVRYFTGGYELNLDGYLLQARLQQHEFMNEIAPWTTNTVRVVTFLNLNNDVDIQFTIVRLGRRGNVADNWDAGGISVAVDKATGVMGAGLLKPKHGGQWMQIHPDSGARFTGRAIPHWGEIIDICTRAAQVTPQMRSIGWDVALTPDGPVIIEGNPDWDLPMVQVHTNGYLTPEVRAKLARFGLAFPEGQLPPISLRQWLTRARGIYRAKRFKWRTR